MSETEEKKNVKKYKERNIILMRVGNKKHYLILALSYSAQPLMLCSWVGKIFTYTIIYVAHFFYIVVFKIAI